MTDSGEAFACSDGLVTATPPSPATATTFLFAASRTRISRSLPGETRSRETDGPRI